MEQTFTIRQKIGQLLTILIPIFVTQFGLFSMSLFDTMMSGQASPVDLAGVAIGSSIWVPAFYGLSGMLMALTPIIAQLIGADQKDQVSYSVTQGIYVALVTSIAVIVGGFFIINPILDVMNLENNVRFIAKNYLFGLSFGIFPLFVYTVLRCFIDALGQTRTTMIITLLTLPINVFFNYVLIFGKFGFPELGGIGAGYASAITYWLIAIIAFIVVRRVQPFSGYRILRKYYPISFSAWKEILLIGLPIGFSIFFESSIFAAVTLLMSGYSTITIAAHQSALNFASFLYMVPMSIAMALTITVGFEVGAKRLKDAKQYSNLGISFAVGMSLICGLFLLFFNEQVAKMYTNDLTVLELTKQFLVFAIFFQLSDAVAAPIQGALRGYKDVNFTFVMAFVSYWIIGLPLGFVLANYSELQAFGYWIGLIMGLAVGAVGLFSRLLYIQRRRHLVQPIDSL